MSVCQSEILRCAVQERTVALHSHQGYVTPMQTAEWNLVNFLMSARELMLSVTRSQAELFRVTSRSGESVLRSTDVGKRFLHTVTESVQARALLRPGHQIDPLVALLFNECDSRHVGLAWAGGGPRSPEMLVPSVDSLNGCVSAIRRKAQRNDFKAKSKRWRDTISDRFTQMTSYFEAVTNAHPASRIVRLDFGYASTQWGLVPPDQGFDDSVADQWRRLLSHIQGLGPCVVGHVWKRDYGVTRGPVFHLVLIVDGPREQELDALVRELMLQWQIQITGGQGISFNCLPATGSPFSVRGGLAIWEFHPAGLENLLHNAAVYLALSDQVVAYDGAGKTPRYGQGAWPDSLQGAGYGGGSWPFIVS